MTSNKLSKVQDLENKLNHEVFKLESKMQDLTKDLDRLSQQLTSTRKIAKSNKKSLEELKISIIGIQENIKYFTQKVDAFIDNTNDNIHSLVSSIDALKPATMKANMIVGIMVFLGMTVGTIIIQKFLTNVI